MSLAELLSHPAVPSPAIRAIAVAVSRLAADRWQIWYLLHGDLTQVVIPPSGPAERSDGLWRHTCCELFARAPGTNDYFEFNFSPSGDWAAYQFDDYRSGRTDAVLTRAPQIRFKATGDRLRVDVELRIDAPALRTTVPLSLACAAVIEQTDGSLSYWALAHPDDKPDFHHADSFAMCLSPLELP